MLWIKKNIWNIFLGSFLAIIVFNPFGIGLQINAALRRLLSFSPPIVKEENRNTLSDYNWNLQTANGQSIDFNQYKGKVVLVNFWATWCPPCVAEMPSLQELYTDYGTKIEFILIANDNPNKVSPFIAKHQYTLPIFYELSSTPILLQSNSIPATYLIDKKGKIVIDKKGSADWNSAKTRVIIDELIAQ